LTALRSAQYTHRPSSNSHLLTKHTNPIRLKPVVVPGSSSVRRFGHVSRRRNGNVDRQIRTPIAIQRPKGYLKPPACLHPRLQVPYPRRNIAGLSCATIIMQHAHHVHPCSLTIEIEIGVSRSGCVILRACRIDLFIFPLTRLHVSCFGQHTPILMY
jgi:hypothetical protein